MFWYRIEYYPPHRALMTADRPEREFEYCQAHSAADAITCFEKAGYELQKVSDIACVEESDVPDREKQRSMMRQDYFRYKNKGEIR